MADLIETREESYAVQGAYDRWVRENPSDEDDERLAFRNGWLAGREWERRQQAAPTEILALLADLHADLCRYAKMTEGVWSSGSIAFSSMADDISRAIRKAKSVGSAPGHPADPAAARAVASGLRLLGCPHLISCTSIEQCSDFGGPRW